jgi:hypothetical protein
VLAYLFHLQNRRNMGADKGAGRSPRSALRQEMGNDVSRNAYGAANNHREKVAPTSLGPK